jgi:hypothetical protein
MKKLKFIPMDYNSLKKIVWYIKVNHEQRTGKDSD